MVNPLLFIPALIVVDFQEDFCPPNGSLAVGGGRDIAPIVNQLLQFPFALKVATKDFHPPDHISFASNHPPPDNIPFVSEIVIHNPYNDSETETTRLWPVHCVQGSPGSELVPELDIAKVDHIIEKGQDKRVEMYSAFADPFLHPTVEKSMLADILKGAGVTHVFVVGLAADYCVKFTAIDSAKDGFKTYVIRQGTRAVDPSSMPDVEAAWAAAGVQLIDFEHEDVQKVREAKK